MVKSLLAVIVSYVVYIFLNYLTHTLSLITLLCGSTSIILTCLVTFVKYKFGMYEDMKAKPEFTVTISVGMTLLSLWLIWILFSMR